MALRIETIVGGPVDTNAYLVADDDIGVALAVDAPLGATAAIVAAAAARGWRIGQIVITHTHWDHVADAAAIKETCGVPLLAGVGATDALERPAALAGSLPVEIRPVSPDRLLEEDDKVTVGGHVFRVLQLPGHEPTHIVLWSEADKMLLGGDVLFPNGHGRTDLPGADQAVMNRSLRRLLGLPADTIVYPGHGVPTTIGAEADWIRRLI
ncbi:MAG: MBL fold metallo-hydrolase [Thermomicrobiales bacterium]|nr:MBL fold metallo-hydrolase [Thermomicrobiales bacterium]